MQFGNDTSVVANAPAWFELQEFKIFSVSGGNRVYRNGRQQLKVRVVVAVADAFHRRVPLTQSELDSIVLVDASSGLPLSKKNRYGPEGTHVWEYMEFQDSRFRELPHNGPVLGSVPPGPFVYVVDFYVSSTSYTPIRVRPRITRADGEMFQFDTKTELASLQLYSLPVAVYRAEQYSLNRTSAPYASTSRDIEKVEVFVLELIIDQQRIEFVTGFNIGTHPRIGSSDRRYTGYYLVGYGNGRYMRTGGAPRWERPDALGGSRSEEGQVALVLAYGKHGGDVWVRDPVSNTLMEFQDMYGNPHQLRLELTDDPLLVRIHR
ncbi:hypothetical protein [Pseudomonas sp. S3_F07]